MTASRPAAALVAGLEELCAALVKAQRDWRRYPRNNPILGHRREELYVRLTPLLERAGTLRLEVGAETLTYEGAEVYRSAERDGLSAPLHRHGVRELVLLRGVTREELEALLDVFNFSPAQEGLDEDLLTFFWERNLEHVRYTASDDVPPGTRWASDPLGMLADVLSVQPRPPAAEAFAAARAQAGAAHDPRPGLAAAQLTPAQQEALVELRQADRRQDVGLAVIDVLLQVLRAAVNSRDLEELLRAVGRIVEASLAEGQLARAASILRQLRQLAAVEERPQVAHALQLALDRAGSAEALAPLVERLRQGFGEVGDEALQGLLRALPPSAAPALTAALEVLEDRRMRRLFCRVVSEMVRDDVQRLAPLMVTDSWYVARNLAYILGLTRNPAGLRLLRELAGHAHEKVRLEALRWASLFPGPTTRALAVRALDDTDASVRVTALGMLGAQPDPAVGRTLVERLQDRGFGKLEPAEQRVLAEAAGRAARDAAVPALVRLLQPRGVLGRLRTAEERDAALYGLAAAGTPQARAALTQAAEQEPALWPLVERALDDVHARQSATPREDA